MSDLYISHRSKSLANFATRYKVRVDLRRGVLDKSRPSGPDSNSIFIDIWNFLYNRECPLNILSIVLCLFVSLYLLYLTFLSVPRHDESHCVEHGCGTRRHQPETAAKRQYLILGTRLLITIITMPIQESQGEKRKGKKKNKPGFPQAAKI